MDDDNLDQLMEIFYENAPYDYVLSFSERKPARLRGLCSYENKVCLVFKEETYLDALWVMLHELAHSLIQHKTHSEPWDRKFAELLEQYDYPKNLVSTQAEAIGPNLRKYMES